MTRSYNRSEIYSFFDLSGYQKAQVISNYFNDWKEASEQHYVILESDHNLNEPIPLSMFIKTTNSKLWDGVYGTSAFTGYFLKLSQCGTTALIADKYF